MARAHLAYEHFKAVQAITNTRAVAAGTGDNTEVTGLTIDRKDAEDVSLIVTCTADLADTETLSITNIDIQESADGSSWDTATNLVATDQVVLTGTSGGPVKDGCFELKVDMATALTRKRYLRFNITFDLSASGTDTADVGAVAILSGLRERGATKTNELTA